MPALLLLTYWMKVYFDNCILNRPFDDQEQIRIKKEPEAILEIKALIQSGSLLLVWSYIIDFEVSRNPLAERRRAAEEWRSFASVEVGPSATIPETANQLRKFGLKEIDSLHIAAAIESKSKYFLTTDDGILGKIERFQDLVIAGPIQFVERWGKL